MSRKLDQSITTNMVAMAIAIEKLNRALRMRAPLARAGKCPSRPGSYPTAVKIFCDGNRSRSLGDRVMIGRWPVRTDGSAARSLTAAETASVMPRQHYK
jgi:hypothetical protein